jgi:RNA polymerase sigma factor (sigma-70 family)
MSRPFSQNTLPPDREYLVTNNLRLVDFVIQKKMGIHPSDMYYDDYQGEGFLGLLKAAIAFDDSRGVKFSTYAVPYIHGYIQRYRREYVNSPLKTSRDLQDRLGKIYKYLNEGYSYEEISDMLNISLADIREALDSSFVVSLDGKASPRSDDEKQFTLNDVICSDDSDIDELIEDEVVINAIEKVASMQKERDMNIWYDWVYPAYFGEHIAEKKLASKYGISQPHVSRCLRRCKRMLLEELGIPIDYLQRYYRHKRK